MCAPTGPRREEESNAHTTGETISSLPLGRAGWSLHVHTTEETFAHQEKPCAHQPAQGHSPCPGAGWFLHVHTTGETIREEESSGCVHPLEERKKAKPTPQEKPFQRIQETLLWNLKRTSCLTEDSNVDEAILCPDNLQRLSILCAQALEEGQRLFSISISRLWTVMD